MVEAIAGSTITKSDSSLTKMVSSKNHRAVLGNLARLELQVAAWNHLDLHWLELEWHLRQSLINIMTSEERKGVATGVDPTHALGHPLSPDLIYHVAEQATMTSLESQEMATKSLPERKSK